MVTQEEIKTKVGSNPRWAERALVVLHDRQERDEQGSRATLHHNGRGFNGLDAQLLSSFAEQVKAGRHLTEKQLVWAYRLLPKYASQLLKVAIEKVTVAGCMCGGDIVADGQEYTCTKCAESWTREELKAEAA